VYEVQQTRWDRLIRRVSGSIGPGSRVSETLSELFPTLDVETMPGELLALGGTKLCIGSATLLGIAAQTSRIQLFNPPDSGNIITVTTVTVSTNIALFVNYAVRQIAIGTPTAFERFRDGRFPTPQRPVGEIRTLSAAPQTDGDGILRALANEDSLLDDPNDLAVLPPGSGFEFGTAGLNARLTVSFRWRERPAEESELSL